MPVILIFGLAYCTPSLLSTFAIYRFLPVKITFDAITSLRPYRAALSYKEAVKELKRCAGTQFDPKLVEAFLPIALTTFPEEVAVGEQTSGHEVT